ncbi:hypothetical protein ACWD6U_22060 [Streptomyces sp. NPDC005149]
MADACERALQQICTAGNIMATPSRSSTPRPTHRMMSWGSDKAPSTRVPNRVIRLKLTTSPPITA